MDTRVDAITKTHSGGEETTLNSLFSLILLFRSRNKTQFWEMPQSSPLIHTNTTSARKTKSSERKYLKDIELGGFLKSRECHTSTSPFLKGKIDAGSINKQIFLKRGGEKLGGLKTPPNRKSWDSPYLLRDLVKVEEFEMLYAEFCLGTRAMTDPSVTWGRKVTRLLD